MPVSGPTPIRLPVMSASERIFVSPSATKWNGVSYIGNSARISRYCLPFVQSPEPFHACKATPIVTNPSCASPASIS